MLTMPLVREVIIKETKELDDDGITIIFKQIINHEPINWSLIDVTRMLELASKLARLSTGQNTERKKIKIDFSKLSDEELEQLANL